MTNNFGGWIVSGASTQFSAIIPGVIFITLPFDKGHLRPPEGGLILCPKTKDMPIVLTNHDNVLERRTPGKASACFHCGEECLDGVIQLEEKTFCCEGCKTVFEILNANNLTDFYRLGTRPGASLRSKKREQFAWLDDETIAARLVDFQNDKIVKVTFQLPQIHCASCIWLLENLYKLDKGILSSKVNFLKKEAYITFDKAALSLRKVAEMLAMIGYAPAIHFGNLEQPRQRKPVDRGFYYQLGVAGFAFGNIMLLSFPEYLGLAEAGYQAWFGYLNLLLSLPVIFYSGRGYLQSAWHGLRNRVLGIDMPISLGILALFGRSAFEIISQTGAGYLDSLAGLIFFLLIGKWFQQKTYHRLSFERDYKSYFPVAGVVKKDGVEKSMALNQLRAGDIAVIKHQELIPADGLLLKGAGLVDYSFVTGESEPVQKEKGELLFAGGRQMGDTIELQLTREVSQSYLTQLWNDDVFSKKTTAGASVFANTVGKYFTGFILVVALSTFFYWLPKDVGFAVNAFTAVLIIACPCAAALSVPFTLGNSLTLLARKGMYLKNTQVIENLVKVNTIVFDKTGTITDGSASRLVYEGVPLSEKEQGAVRSVAYHSTHPVSKQINAVYRHLPLMEVTGFEEEAGQGVRGRAGGMEVTIRKSDRGAGLAINGLEKGRFLMKNQLREGLERLITHWKGRFQLFLLSGDDDREKHKLLGLFREEALLFRQSPKDKLDFIKNLQAKGNKVMMIGDGLNDAGALKQSDTGLVISENTNNFTPACDAILDARQFAALPVLLTFIKGSMRMVYGAYLLALIYNIGGLSIAVQGSLSPVVAAILMPLSSLTIVIFGVGSTRLLAARHLTKITPLSDYSHQTG